MFVEERTSPEWIERPRLDSLTFVPSDCSFPHLTAKICEVAFKVSFEVFHISLHEVAFVGSYSGIPGKKPSHRSEVKASDFYYP